MVFSADGCVLQTDSRATICQVWRKVMTRMEFSAISRRVSGALPLIYGTLAKSVAGYDTIHAHGSVWVRDFSSDTPSPSEAHIPECRMRSQTANRGPIATSVVESRECTMWKVCWRFDNHVCEYDGVKRVSIIQCRAAE